MIYDLNEIANLPDTFSLEDLRVVCHISKRTARYYLTFDIHDRVNYSVEHSQLCVLTEEKVALLELTVDTQFSSIMAQHSG